MDNDPAITAAWTRNASDELAVKNGCWFNPLKGAYAVWWIERYCRLYEGARAGEPLILRGCHECGEYGIEVPQEWNDEAEDACLLRAAKYAECVAAGHATDWQYDCTMRVFGWVKWSAQWKRWLRRFRESTIFIAKKNKKSPTLSAWASYMLIGDEEPGQKCFLAAKDGEQARQNTAKHAINMFRQSEELMECCTINKTLNLIRHEPTLSEMYPLSSDNERTQKSKEGLNGSVFVDEVHVVDREFVARISRAGISRAEPLFAEFSTAGNDPMAYGKDRFDLAERVINGTEERQSLFAAIYAASQDLKDEDLAADPLKWGRIANPAMGHTVDPEEYLDDYKNSCTKPSSLAEFKMYRLNIWQASSSPFLRMADWQACRRDYSEAELLGRPCCAGLDLALKWDVSAFVLVFPWEDDEQGEKQFRIIPRMWLPRDRAHTMRDKVPWENYAQRGWITLTDGDVADFPLIRREINEACDKYDVQVINYDDRFAEAFCQELQDEDGLPVQDFAQTPRNYNEPTFMLERLTIAGRLHHPGNGVLDWMAGNMTIKKGMPAKPDSENYKKIDGMTALIMGLAGCLNVQESPLSVYDRESRGFTVI